MIKLTKLTNNSNNPPPGWKVFYHSNEVCHEGVTKIKPRLLKVCKVKLIQWCLKIKPQILRYNGVRRLNQKISLFHRHTSTHSHRNHRVLTER